MRPPHIWVQAIVLGFILNIIFFFSLATLSRKHIVSEIKVLTVEFMAWQEPRQVKETKPAPRKRVKAKKKNKPKLKKKRLKKPELTLQEPIQTPKEVVEDIAEETIEEVDEVLPTPVPIFEVSSLPRFVHRASPVYPPAMKQQGKEGSVLIEALVDATGKVRKVDVIQSAGALFDQAAVSAIEASTFIPAHINGKSVPVLMRVPIRFRLR